MKGRWVPTKITQTRVGGWVGGWVLPPTSENRTARVRILDHVSSREVMAYLGDAPPLPITHAQSVVHVAGVK